MTKELVNVEFINKIKMPNLKEIEKEYGWEFYYAYEKEVCYECHEKIGLFCVMGKYYIGYVTAHTFLYGEEYLKEGYNYENFCLKCGLKYLKDRNDKLKKCFGEMKGEYEERVKRDKEELEKSNILIQNIEQLIKDNK